VTQQSTGADAGCAIPVRAPRSECLSGGWARMWNLRPDDEEMWIPSRPATERRYPLL
jgi:hypothetical protein